MKNKFRLIAFLLVLPALTWPVCAASPKHHSPAKVCARLQAATVYVRPSATTSGSGILFKSGGGWYCLTCAHVAWHASTEEKPTAADDFNPIWLTQQTADPAIGSVAQAKVKSVVVLYNKKIGLAVLKLLAIPPALWQAVKWHVGPPPPVGTPVYHCGSPCGINGIATITDGIISAIGRDTEYGVMDQCSAPTMPGSSGGLIALKDGTAIGVLSRGPGEAYSLYVPARTVLKWLANHDLTPGAEAATMPVAD